ncbi:hypothetical protein DFP73DRAFT_543573 [Morchella snyderi]|nr:hypothetical protein DFP73DRAFT_543573 [Morchella snyderi]
MDLFFLLHFFIFILLWHWLGSCLVWLFLVWLWGVFSFFFYYIFSCVSFFGSAIEEQKRIGANSGFFETRGDDGACLLGRCF